MKKSIMAILMCAMAFTSAHALFEEWRTPPDMPSKQEVKAFQRDVKNGKFSQKTRAALKRAALVNSRDEKGNTPLMMATFKGNYQMVKDLLDNGAIMSIDWLNNENISALCIAVEMKRVKTVALLLERGASANLKCGFDGYHKSPKSPLLIAAENGAVPEIIQALVDKKAKVNFATAYGGITPLMRVAECGSIKSASILLKAGANVNAKTTGSLDRGVTPAWFAIFSGNLPMLKLIMERGGRAEPFESDDAFVFPIDVAKSNGGQEMVEYLKIKGYDY